ncbi:DUF4892 domain-containing protein [Aliikangiella sp. IMCC44359]|uniref:DUF4892 domain-containing protein n=1 Tax=Aliikangiella sp. IMCC44359 TaxID=3459125 RepID=UPI00403ABAEA
MIFIKHKFSMKYVLFFILLSSIASIEVNAARKDKKGSQDHPLISRYPDSYIYNYNNFDFDEFYIATSPVYKKKMQTQRVTGKLSGLVYRLPSNVTDFQAMENYTQALKKQGFKKIFQCVQEACGMSFAHVLFNKHNSQKYKTVELSNMHGKRRFRYWVGKWQRPQGDIYVSLLALNKGGKSSWLQQHVVESKPMKTGLITLTPDSLNRDINQNGKAVLEGLFFEYNKSELKQDSNNALNAIAAYLKNNPQIKAYVVGHTDNSGNDDYNLKLSQARANSVKETLVKKYKINTKRLTPIGIGPYSPVTSNSDQDGKAKNRRVELVLRN